MMILIDGSKVKQNILYGLEVIEDILRFSLVTIFHDPPSNSFSLVSDP